MENLWKEKELSKTSFELDRMPHKIRNSENPCLITLLNNRKLPGAINNKLMPSKFFRKLLNKSGINNSKTITEWSPKPRRFFSNKIAVKNPISKSFSCIKIQTEDVLTFAYKALYHSKSEIEIK